MRKFQSRLVFTLLTALTAAAPHALGQHGFDPAPRLAAQREAMKALERMDGTWRGTATILQPDGQKHTITQTERVGPMLDGTVRVVEGRGYEPDGSTAFNAFAVISYDVDRKAYNFRSYAHSFSGDYVFKPTADGFTWEMSAGPMTMRYTTVIKDNIWHEVGDRIMPDGQSIRFIEMKLTRLGDSTWPLEGSVSPK